MCALKKGPKWPRAPWGSQAATGFPLERGRAIDPGVVLYLFPKGMSVSKRTNFSYRDLWIEGTLASATICVRLEASEDPKRSVDRLFRLSDRPQRRQCLAAACRALDAFVFTAESRKLGGAIRHQIAGNSDGLV